MLFKRRTQCAKGKPKSEPEAPGATQIAGQGRKRTTERRKAAEGPFTAEGAKVMAVNLQLANGQGNRLSEIMGPYDYVEITYNALWAPDRVKELIHMDEQGYWVCNVDGQLYTDITIFSADE